ncbi:MAG: orotate phosphoribosyltransferase [Acidimicrobiales bacterium]
MSTASSGGSAKDRLIAHLLEHSIKRGDFVLKSGRPSPYFLDSKQTACDPDGVVLMADVALELIPADATAIGGITVGADPVAYGIAAVAATRGRRLSSFTIRKEAKDHGVVGRVAGALKPGDRVVITEDTTSRGVTLADAIEVVREFGAEPVLVLALVDRGGTAEGYAAAAGVPFVALATAPDLGFPYDSAEPESASAAPAS